MDEVPLWGFILIHAVVVVFNALLSAMSVYVANLNDSKVKKLAEDGHRYAIAMLHIDNVEKKLSAAIVFTAGLLNTLSYMFAVHPFCTRVGKAVAEQLTEQPSALGKGVAAAVVAVLVLIVSVLLGYFIPTRVAQVKNDEKTARQRQSAALVLYRALKPVVWLMVKLSDSVGKEFVDEDSESQADITEDEILMMVDAVGENGAIESNEKQMIENIFNFSSTTASMVMTHRTNLIAIPVDKSMDEVLEVVTKTGKSRFPVYDGDIDHIIGILMARDFMINLHSESPKPITELLRKPYIVPETIKTNVLFKNMQKTNTHIAVVIDEYGGTSGIVTLEDLLEELVGNIYDESDMDEEKGNITRLEENVWRVAGNVDLETLSEALMIDLPEDEEYDTIGGLVLSNLSSLPDDDEHPEVFANGLYIYVEEVQNRRITWVKVSLVMTVETLKKSMEE